MSSLWSRARARIDSFVNTLTGIGSLTRDKLVAGATTEVRPLSSYDCEQRWRGDPLGGALVEKHPRAMMREGWEINIQPTDDEDADRNRRLPPGAAALAKMAQDAQSRGEVNRARQLRAFVRDAAPVPRDSDGVRISEALMEQQRRLGLNAALYQALCFERCYGGAVVYVAAQDGRQPWEPLDETAIETITHLTAFAGGIDGEAVGYSWYPRLLADAKYGVPRLYQLRNIGTPVVDLPAPGEVIKWPTGAASVTAGDLLHYVHESRLLVFGGPLTSRRARTANYGWGDSVFIRVDEVLSQYGQSWGAVAHLLTDWAQGVLKIPGLMQMIAEKQESLIQDRAVTLDMSRSIARVMLLDGGQGGVGGEEFKREVTPLSGLDGVLVQLAVRVAASADMPVTILMGQSPAGLNATGDSDHRTFNDTCAGMQERGLTPAVERLTRLQLLAKDGPTQGREPERWTIEMRPLWQMTEAEKATIRKTIADRDAIEIDRGIVTPEEVAISRHGGSKWSMDTVIDLNERRAMREVPEEGEEGTRTPAGEPTIPPQITPTMQGSFVTVNRALSALGFPPWPGPDGDLPIVEFEAKRAAANAATIAAAAQAEAGNVAPAGGAASAPPPPAGPPAVEPA
jgi:phage-related protein (TIGR01555 family)